MIATILMTLFGSLVTGCLFVSAMAAFSSFEAEREIHQALPGDTGRRRRKS